MGWSNMQLTSEKEGIRIENHTEGTRSQGDTLDGLPILQPSKAERRQIYILNIQHKSFRRKA
jgi:hypothetical protein